MNRKTLVKNYKPQIGVFLLAVLFWLLVKMSKEYDHTVQIPLSVTISNDDYCLKHPAPENVYVQFSGRGIDLLQLSFYSPAYEVDLSDERGNFDINLSEHHEYVRLSDELSVRVRSIVRPHEITFELDRRLVKKVPVIVDANVKTENGFILVDYQPEPDSVEVTGPAVYVDTLTALRTVFRTYSKANLVFRDKLPLKGTTSFFARYQPGVIDVLFAVQRLAEKEIVNVPVKIVNVPANYEVVPLPSSVKIYVKGGEKVLAEALPGDFEVVIDFQRDWQPGATQVIASVETDLNISYVESRPAHFELIVQKRRNKP